MLERRSVLTFFLLVPAAYPPLQTPRKNAAQPQQPAARAAKLPARAPATLSLPAQRWMRSLSLRDKVAQLVIIKSFGDLPPRRSAAYRNFLRLVRDSKVGGLIVVNRVVNGSVRSAEPYELAAFLNRMQKLAT